MRNLPQLLRDAERRVNAHVWPNRPETLGRDSHLVSIPANRDTDTDLLLIEAADRIRDLEASLNSLWPGLVLDLRHADMDDDIDALRSRVDTVREVLCYAPPPPAPAYPGSTTDSEDVPENPREVACAECGGSGLTMQPGMPDGEPEGKPCPKCKSKQFAPIGNGTICSNCTKTIGYHYQTAAGVLWCRVPQSETAGERDPACTCESPHSLMHKQGCPLGRPA